jgi:hypothetical protein
LEADQQYQDCSEDAYNALEETQYEWMRGVTSEVEGILEQYPNIRWLFYNGMLDLMCDHNGLERWVDRLQWHGREGFTKAWRHGWTPLDEGPPVAYAKEHQQLSLLKIKNAGHFVPIEQPYIALEMIRRVMHGYYFKGYGGQDLDANDPEEPKDGNGNRCSICQDCNVVAEKAVSAARIQDMASANQNNDNENDSNNNENSNNNTNNNNNNNDDTVNDVDDEYYYDWWIMLLWIGGSVALICLAFNAGRRGWDKEYDRVAMNYGVDEGNHFIDEDGRLT